MSRKNEMLPAILGGTPAVTLDHGPANTWPRLDEDDIRAAAAVIRDGNISTHPVIRALERDYRDFTGRTHALAHNNGTSALLAAFFSIGLKPGDEVLVPSATFWASVLPLLWLGAVPVFCESEEERMGIDPVDVEAKITDRTRAIVVVHLWGLPCKMTELYRIARQHDLRIIEDASHAHGALWRGRSCGALGDVSVFSLQGDKLAPAGEGGILLTDRADYFERAVCLGDITRISELQTPARRFAATSFGLKTRIAPLSAALGRNQLRLLAGHNALRTRNVVALSRRLEAFGFHTFLQPDHIERVYFEFLIRYDEQRTGAPLHVLMTALQAEGCHVTLPRYPLLHRQPFFREGTFLEILRPLPGAAVPDYVRCELPRTEAANGKLLKLPSFPGCDNGILDQYEHAFEKVLQHIDDLRSLEGLQSQ